MSIRVTVVDTETGQTETQEIRDDYVLITAGSCEATGVVVHANGTHQLTIKGVRRT